MFWTVRKYRKKIQRPKVDTNGKPLLKIDIIYICELREINIKKYNCIFRHKLKYNLNKIVIIALIPIVSKRK